jgi:carboxypeptidase C (cathepsin A)
VRAIARLLTCAALAASCTLWAIAADRPRPVDPLAGVSKDAVTHHSISLPGGRLNYTARAGTIVIRDTDEKPQATMFYTAYTLDGANPSNRPVTFLYNGGPGSATLWLRMGSFGPVRVQTGNGVMTKPAPFVLADNRYTLLDTTDLVFVDMAASGFGRILPGGDPKKIFGSDNDIKAFSQFVTRYLTANGRWNSPKVLFGESYGTPRTAMLVNALQNDGVGINGIVLQSSILNDGLASSGTYGGASTDDWQYVFAFPTMAATAYFYRAVPGAPPTITAYMKDVQAFAMGEYRRALNAGANLSPSAYSSVLAKLARYTGLSQTYLRNNDLRVSSQKYLAEFRRSHDQTMGAYDARFRLYALDQETENSQLEPSDASIDAAYVATTNDYLRRTLGYSTNLPYLTGAYGAIQAAGGWDFTHQGTLPLNTAPDLAQAMTYNPSLRVFSANGWYDSVTPYLATVYTLNHLEIAKPLLRNITYGFYPSGHMIYLNQDALATYHADLERWYKTIR